MLVALLSRLAQSTILELTVLLLYCDQAIVQHLFLLVQSHFVVDWVSAVIRVLLCDHLQLFVYLVTHLSNVHHFLLARQNSPLKLFLLQILKNLP